MNSKILEIKNTIYTAWQSNYTETPTEYPNIDFDGDRSKPFVKLSIQFGSSNTVIKGQGTMTRHTGLIRINIKIPVLKGVNKAYEIADIAANILERKSFGDLHTRSSTLYEVGVVDEYFTLVLSVPFLDN